VGGSVSHPETTTRARLEGVFRAALAAVEPGRCVRAALRRDAGGLAIAGEPVPRGARVFALGLGKAGAAMVAAALEVGGPQIADAIALVPDGFERPLARGRLLRGSHPLPDARGAAATREICRAVASLKLRDVLLVLLSGGSSSLLCEPAAGVELPDVAAAARALLEGGASIEELNAVRKHLSAATGGRLAKASGAGRVQVLAISDVAGDRLDVLGSGPFAPDPTGYADALAVLARRDPRRRAPASVRAHLEAGVRGQREETPKPGDPAFGRVRHTLIASNATAVGAACRAAEAAGWRGIGMPGCLAGEARRTGRRLAALSASLGSDAPICLAAGGETVVTVRGDGRGGRSQELALAAALELAGRRDTALLAAGTDGADGPTDAAGAFVDGSTVERGRRAGVDAVEALADNDSHRFFAREGGLVRTGPTGTNVADLALVFCDARR